MMQSHDPATPIKQDTFNNSQIRLNSEMILSIAALTAKYSTVTDQVNAFSFHPAGHTENEEKLKLETDSEPKQKHPLDDPDMRAMLEEQREKRVLMLAQQSQDGGENLAQVQRKAAPHQNVEESVANKSTAKPFIFSR